MVNYDPILIRTQVYFCEILLLAEKVVEYLTRLTATIICWEDNYVYIVIDSVQMSEIIRLSLFSFSRNNNSGLPRSYARLSFVLFRDVINFHHLPTLCC